MPLSSFSIISLFSLIISTTSSGFATLGGCPFADGYRMANLIFNVVCAHFWAKDVPIILTSEGLKYASSSQPLRPSDFNFLQETRGTLNSVICSVWQAAAER